MLKEQTLDTGIVTINYAEGPPSGPPLVLLHGGGDRWQHFLPLIPTLILRWHLYALDLRGHGASGRASGHYRPEHYVSDLSVFLQHLINEPAILLGHSLGGWIALMAAAEMPERVLALVLGDPPLNIDRFLTVESEEQRVAMWQTYRTLLAAGLSVQALAASLASSQTSSSGRNDAHLSSLAKTLSQVDPDVIQYHAEGRLERYVANVDIAAALGRMTCPVLVLQADPSQGGRLTDSDVDHVLSILENGSAVQLTGHGHDLGLESWQTTPLLRALIGFLESL